MDETQHSDPISTPETELEMFSSNSESHTFHSSILDDFQLDLELECEEDGTSFSIGDTNYCSYSLESDVSPTVCLPLTDAHQDFTETKNQSQSNAPITELITMNYNMDHRRKEEDIFPIGEGIYVRKRAEEGCKNSQRDPFKCSSSLSSGKNESSSFILDRNIPHNCMTVICPVCKILFSSLESLQSHVLDQHSKVKTEPDIDNSQSSRCGTSQCPRLKNPTKNRKTQSFDRKKKCKNLGPFHCQICSYVGSKRASLRQHMKQEHNPKRETLTCRLCSFSCVQERSLKVHLLTHEGVEGKFACDQCGKLFFTMGILKRHARTHNTSRPYICQFDKCNKTFTIKSRLTDHLRTVHKSHSSLKKIKTAVGDNKEKEIIRQLNEVEGIKPGVDSAYGTDALRGISCNSTNSEVQRATSSQARQHDEIEFDKDLTIVYDIIFAESLLGENSGSRQKDKSKQPTLNLKDTSTSESSDSSSLSQLSVFSVQNLKNKHSGCEKKFVCSWTGCEKRFRDNYNLRKHMGTHTGEMERACPLCRYRCIQKSALDKHMKTHKKRIFGKML